jgi:ABC-type polar amino acid transport system, ATPase component
MKLKTINLRKSFNGKVVLDNINLDIDDFHSLAVIGPSGSGKSTFLRIIAGLLMPDSGDVYINDEPVPADEKKLNDYRKTIGVVFQSYNLFPHLTAVENIVLPLTQVHRIERHRALETTEKLLNRFQLIEHRDKKPSELSGGQQQRVAVARALALDSKFLLFDEPTSALDPELTAEVLNMINELERQEKDLILVTHEMGFARHSCDRVIFMDNGRILEQGSSRDVFTNPKTVELRNFLNKILEWR